MKITYWGVRGTIASPGPATSRYGGNTSCVSVETDNAVIILDAGSGVRALGEKLFGRGKKIVIAFSHRHYDHVSGLPFFTPLYDPKQTLILLGVRGREDGGIWYATDLMDGTLFPKRFDEIPSRLERKDPATFDWLAETGVNVSMFSVNHPGGAYGFRVRTETSTFVHVPDNELGSDAKADALLLEMASGCDVLSHDAQFVESDLPQKFGWGHSLMNRVCDVALQAGVGTLVLFHHDPNRSDSELDRLNDELSRKHKPLRCVTAYEGLSITLD